VEDIIPDDILHDIRPSSSAIYPPPYNPIGFVLVILRSHTPSCFSYVVFWFHRRPFLISPRVDFYGIGGWMDRPSFWEKVSVRGKRREGEGRRTGEVPDGGDVYIYVFCSTGGRGARKSIVNVNEVKLR
jgi:hypothetical protein